VASPDLHVRVQGAQAQVAGAVVIPEAKLTLKELPATAVPVSSDVVLAGAPAKPPGEAALRVTSDVDIRLGNQVAFSGFGLSGRIQGRLRVRERGTGAPTGQGELEIKEGRYRAYGQSLEIERGRILFAGPLANPSLDVRAVRKADEVTAGLQVSGPAEAPLADLFSDPPMEDTQILSYLVLGRSLADTSGAEGALLSSAASSLGAGGAGMLSSQLQQGLGLDEVKVESEGGLEQAAVTLGRYLSPKLYVGYSMGLFESTSAVVLRYDLTKRLMIEAQSGSQSGADLFYHFEK
jgi:translocation and assembly module TamB